MESFSGIAGLRPQTGEPQQPPKAHKPAPKRGPALAYQFGNTIIVEDEDGEVLKKYDIPGPPKQKKPATGDRTDAGRTLQRIKNMGSYLGMHPQTAADAAEGVASASDGPKKNAEEDDDDNIRFTVTAGGRRMSKLEFIQQIQKMDPKSRAQLVENSDAPETVKREARKDAKESVARSKQRATSSAKLPQTVAEHDGYFPPIMKTDSPANERPKGPEGHTLVDSEDEDVPFHPVGKSLQEYSLDKPYRETAAQRRRRESTHPFPRSPAPNSSSDVDGDDEKGEKETAVEKRRRIAALSSSPQPSPGYASGSGSDVDPMSRHSSQSHPKSQMDSVETAAERRRRLGALGLGAQDSDSESEDGEEGGDPLETGRGAGVGEKGEVKRAPGIRFAELPEGGSVSKGVGATPGVGGAQGGASASGAEEAQESGRGSRLRWGKDVGKKAKR
jgi:hypothetical protein